MAGPRTTPTDLRVPELIAAVVEDHIERSSAEAAQDGSSRIREAMHLALRRDALALRALAGGDA